VQSPLNYPQWHLIRENCNRPKTILALAFSCLTAVVERDKRASLLDPFILPFACFSPFYLFSFPSLSRSLSLSLSLMLYRDQEIKHRLLNGVASNHDSYFSAVDQEKAITCQSCRTTVDRGWGQGKSLRGLIKLK
jgi:hypothetical protein